MSSSKKILVTTSTFPSFSESDSTPVFVYELARRLAKRGLGVVVSAPYLRNSKEYEEREGLKIYRYKYGFTALRDKGAILPNIKKNKVLVFQVPFFLLFSFLNLVKLVKKEKIDIIHAHWIIPQGFLAILYKKLSRKKGLKVICTVHGGDIFSLRGWLMTKIKKWTLENTDAITVVSSGIKEEVKRIGIKNNLVSVMPMGVDERVFNPSKYDRKIKERYDITGPFLLFVGRLVEKKGAKYAISVMPAVLKKYPNTKLMIIGDGPLKEDLKQQARKLNLENNVIFTGGIPNNKLPKYYSTADIFLGPSITAKNGDSEGFGLVFVEALLCKCCVISSNLKTISDIVRNEETGIQVDVRNVKLFASKIIELIEDQDKRKKLAENGYRFARNNFTWNISSERYYKLIESLL